MKAASNNFGNSTLMKCDLEHEVQFPYTHDQYQ